VKEFGPLQSLQAQDLVAALAGRDPVILVGDFNSDPYDPAYLVTVEGVPTPIPTPYQLLTSPLGGFADVWPRVRQGPGRTCCFDADLAPPSRDLTERVDLVLFRDGLRPRAAFRVGLAPLDALGDRWPSDHAGVVAVLRLREPGQGGPGGGCD
jgi:endonuclease/exonuclease/phosphatase family metal-dependent hydrolase